MVNGFSRHTLSIVLAVAALGIAAPAAAQDRIGGHFGTVIPIVSRAGGATTTLSDDFKIGFPTGITVKSDSPWAFDLEFVPVVTSSRFASLTLHPGVIRSLPNRFAAGMRMAFDVRESSWGFTPLLNHGFPVGRMTYFVEGVVPIRFQQNAVGRSQTSVGLAAHVGVGF
jgi:hypothetical protein